MTEYEPLAPDAAAFTAFRALSSGEGRTYSVSVATDGRAGLERFVHRCVAVGYLTPATGESYAVLDVLDGNDDIVQDYGIPHARAWRWIKRKLHLTADSLTDTEEQQ